LYTANSRKLLSIVSDVSYKCRTWRYWHPHH